MTPEAKAALTIDALLISASWHLSIIREVETEVDANLERALALRQATLAKAFAPSELIQYARQ